MDQKWLDIIQEESKKEYYKQLMSFIDHEYKTKTIFPKREDIFNAFEFTPFDNVKIVIIGQDPYHDVGQAHGLAFSVLKGNKIPPSLRNIYSELLDDIGVLPPHHGDLTEWALNGVLLMNTVFTVEAHKANSHKNKGWEQFSDSIIKRLSQDDVPKVFILWGNHARKKKDFINQDIHMIIESSHPSPLGARHSFFKSKCFSRANQFLRDNKRTEVDFTLTW